MAFSFFLYPIEYEKVSYSKVLIRPFSFRLFLPWVLFSLGGIKLIAIFAIAKKDTGVAQLVEHWSPKPGVGRSSRSSRAKAALSGSFFCFKESLWYL